MSESRTAAGTHTQRFKLHGRMAALMALAKHRGLFAGPLKQPGGQDDENGKEGDAEDAGDAREILARRISVIAARLGTDRDPEGGSPG